MAFTEYTGDTTIIGALGTNPAERGLTTQEFKDKFDQFAKEFVAWFNATHVVEADAHLADYAKGTMIRIILNISANSGDGVVNYVLGEEYVQSVVSSAYGIDINLKNIQNDAKVSSNFVITSGGGISIGGSGINPFIFQRAVSYTKLQLGIKTSPSSSHYPWNTIPSGTIRVTIAW